MLTRLEDGNEPPAFLGGWRSCDVADLLVRPTPAPPPSLMAQGTRSSQPSRV
ncbi:hypothetical protein BJX66DRAFT_307026 [Aspergillus keveii]|uniref:Uncharacterized protein n=1 Tax=Aspergillus keveii TaxID=714993 RepID=A0ABR4G1I8_9EURO